MNLKRKSKPGQVGKGGSDFFLKYNSVITEYSDINGPNCGETPLPHTAFAVCACGFHLGLLQVALPAWVWMWLIALALFLAAKWITVSRFLGAGGTGSRLRIAVFCLLWPGMDAGAFTQERGVTAAPSREWIAAVSKSIFGATALWVAVSFTDTKHRLIIGWLGMIGIVFLLHFGAFHLLSLAWRTLGINAEPIMQSPGKATSLSKFWRQHWNLAFSDLVHGNLFKPLTRFLGPRGSLLFTFIFSGLVHELVISVPARGGYGLPTAYFLLQGCGVAWERSRSGRKLGLSSGWKGRCFVALIAGVPAFWLLHPGFVYHVILPMLDAIGATGTRFI